MKRLFLSAIALFSVNSFANEPFPFEIKDPQTFTLYVQNSVADLKKATSTPNNRAWSFLSKAYKSNDIYTAFKENELSAGKQFKDKPLRILFTMDSIKEGLLGNVVIFEKSAKALLGSTSYHMKNSDDEKLLKIKRGEKLDLTCKFDNFSMDSLSFNDCYFSSEYIEKAYNKVLNNQQKLLTGIWKPNSSIDFLLAVSYFSVEDKIQDLCSRNKKCSFVLLEKEKVSSKDALSDEVSKKLLIYTGKPESFNTLPNID